MPWSTERLLAQIRLGEHGSLGLKEVVFSGKRMTDPHGPSLADELAALANSHGGSLLLGVNDRTREITGIPTDRFDAVECRVSEFDESELLLTIFAAGPNESGYAPAPGE